MRHSFSAGVMVALLIGISCSRGPDSEPTTADLSGMPETHATADTLGRDAAMAVISRAMRAHGAAVLGNAVLEFDFRGDRYVARRARGLFSYERHYSDSSGTVRDVISNNEIFRELNGKRSSIGDRTRNAILSRVNSIIYFASLPYPLGDPAVIPRYIGRSTIRGAAYDKVEITFRREGGGPDYRDRFIYWVNRDTDLIDYFAYYYYTDETGSRLRKLVNRRNVNGFLVVDHLNYVASPDTLGTRVELYDQLIESGGLEQVSEVRHENVTLVHL